MSLTANPNLPDPNNKLGTNRITPADIERANREPMPQKENLIPMLSNLVLTMEQIL